MKLLLLIFAITIQLVATANKIDSLKALLEKADHDSIKVRLKSEIGEAAWIFREGYWDTIAHQAHALNMYKQEQLAYNNLGYIYQEHGDHDNAIKNYVISLKLAVDKKDIPGLCSAHNNLGTMYFAQGKIDTALSYFSMNLRIHRKSGATIRIARSLANVGAIYHHSGDIPNALSSYNEALGILEKLDDPRTLTSVLNNLAFIYEEQDELQMSHDMYRRCLAIYKELNDLHGIASTMNNIASNYDRRGDTATTLSLYRQSFEIFKQLNDKEGMANAINNIAFIGKDTIDDIKNYKLALDLYTEIGNVEGQIQALSNLGSRYAIAHNFKLGKYYGEQALEKAKFIGYPRLIQLAAYNLYRLNKKLKKFGKALDLYELNIQMRDSMSNKETHKATIKQQMSYEHEKQVALMEAEQAKKDAIAVKERQKQSLLSYSLAGGFGLVLIIAFIFYRSMIARKKANELINNQKLEVEQQRDIVKLKNQEILDSIDYAQKIQNAILPPPNLVKEYLKESFILYQPKDIVAGDFYWLETMMESNNTVGEKTPENNVVFFSVADCTGHGVPGAMMSVMCSNALTRCVKELDLTEPAEILDQAAKIVESRFERSEQMVVDGMDLALCTLNLKTLELEYSGANNPLWIISNNELQITNADKQPIGHIDGRVPYTNHKIQLQKSDTIYIFSDGLLDQFGGVKGKKYKSKRFQELLLSIQEHDMDQQFTLIKEEMENWRGTIEQIDDNCLMGVRV